MALSPHPRTSPDLEVANKYGPKIILGLVGAAMLLGSILLSNWAVDTFHFIPVGFGQYAVAGVLFAGVALAARDLVQDAWGRLPVVGLIVIGSLMSFIFAAPQFAIASAVAFLLAEGLDFAIYTPLRARAKFGDKRWALAVVASNIVGAVVDTFVFIGIAFGFSQVLGELAGQMIGKTYATVMYLILGYLASKFLLGRVSAWLDRPIPSETLSV